MKKQPIKTPSLMNCVCGCTPEVVWAPAAPHHYETHYTVRCPNCTKEWPRNAGSKHRAICKWNNHQEKLMSN